MSNSAFRFEIAISFAGDNKRCVVRKIMEILRHKVGEGKVFFDEWFEAELAGHDAQTVLQEIYRKKTRLVVTCVCKRYSQKPWTQEEWRAIQCFERELRDAGSDNFKRMRFLPLRFDDGEIDGLLPTAIVPDVRERSPEDIADLILARLELATVPPGEAIDIDANDVANPLNAYFSTETSKGSGLFDCGDQRKRPDPWYDSLFRFPPFFIPNCSGTADVVVSLFRPVSPFW